MMQAVTLSGTAYWLMEYASEQYGVELHAKEKDWKDMPSAVADAIYHLFIKNYI